MDHFSGSPLKSHVMRITGGDMRDLTTRDVMEKGDRLIAASTQFLTDSSDLRWRSSGNLNTKSAYLQSQDGSPV